MIYSIASQKGGVGKTSSAISLSSGIARKGKRVLFVDIDLQANSSKVLLHNYPHLQKDQTIYATILERSPLPVHKTYVPNLDIVPSHILLSNTDVELTTAIDHREARLKRELEVIAHNYDYVFIDCPHTLSWLPGRPDAGPTHTGLSEKGRQRLLHNGEGCLAPANKPTCPHFLRHEQQ